MDNLDHHGLFSAYVKKFKPVGSSSTQFIGLCPFHEDSKESFTMTTETGLCNCFSCGYKANAYKFAKDVGHPNPKEFIVEMNGRAHPTARSLEQPVAEPPPPVDLEKTMDQLKSNLKNNIVHYPKIWDKKLIDEIGIGLDTNNKFHFAHHDVNGNIIAIRTHKGKIVGDGRSKWYLRHLIASYDRNKPIYITEGEKDALVLISQGLQAVSGSTGCLSIPKDSNGYYDLEWLKEFAEIFVCYDLDDAGQKGGLKLATEIVKAHPNLNVKIIKWDEHLDKGFDIFNAFMSDGEFGADFFNACWDAIIIKPVIPERFGGLKFKSGVDAMQSDAQPTFELIESLLPQNQQILIAGTMKANKSMMCMQMGMAMANNESKFLEFDINARDIEILYVDSENGEKIFDYRLQMLATTFNDFANNGAKRFNYITKDKREPDMMMRIDDAVKYFRPDVLFVDCLYNCTGGIDMGKDYSLTPVLESITEMKQKYNLTIPAVHHLNKGLHELGLISDRMRGASNLLFWMEHSVLMCRTNDPFLRLMKFGETRSIGVPDCYYGLEFNPKDYSLTSKGIVEYWEQYLITAKKKRNYEYYLSFMDDEFTTDDWHKKTWDDEVPASTSEKWLYHCRDCKMIEDEGYGHWKKKLKVI